MLVKAMKQGETTMYFHDDFCKDKTSEEVDAMLKDYVRIAYPALKAQYIKKLQKQESDKTGADGQA